MKKHLANYQRLILYRFLRTPQGAFELLGMLIMQFLFLIGYVLSQPHLFTSMAGISQFGSVLAFVSLLTISGILNMSQTVFTSLGQGLLGVAPLQVEDRIFVLFTGILQSSVAGSIFMGLSLSLAFILRGLPIFAAIFTGLFFGFGLLVLGIGLTFFLHLVVFRKASPKNRVTYVGLMASLGYMSGILFMFLYKIDPALFFVLGHTIFLAAMGNLAVLMPYAILVVLTMLMVKRFLRVKNAVALLQVEDIQKQDSRSYHTKKIPTGILALYRWRIGVQLKRSRGYLSFLLLPLFALILPQQESLFIFVMLGMMGSFMSMMEYRAYVFNYLAPVSLAKIFEVKVLASLPYELASGLIMALGMFLFLRTPLWILTNGIFLMLVSWLFTIFILIYFRIVPDKRRKMDKKAAFAYGFLSAPGMILWVLEMHLGTAAIFLNLVLLALVWLFSLQMLGKSTKARYPLD